MRKTKKYEDIALVFIMLICGVVFLVFQKSIGKRFYPGEAAHDNIYGIFVINDAQFYVTAGGNLFSAEDGKKAAKFPNGKILWADSISAFLYIESGNLYKRSFYNESELCANLGIISEPLLFAITANYAIIRDNDRSSFSLFRVAFDGYEIQKILDRCPGDTIANSDDFIYLYDGDTIYELDCNSGILKELLSERLQDIISYALIDGGILYYLLVDCDEIEHCKTSLSSTAAKDIRMPSGMPDARTIGFAFHNDKIIIARCDEARISLYSFPNSEYIEDTGFLLLSEADLIFEVPGTFMLSVASDSLCYALKTRKNIAFVRTK